MSLPPENTAAVYLHSADDHSYEFLSRATNAVGYGWRRYADVAAMAESVSATSVGCILLPVSETASAQKVIASLQQRLLSLPIIILLEGESADDAVAYMQLGVHSVVANPHTEQKLMAAIDSAVNVSVRGQTAHDSSRDAANRMSKATTKEREVLDLITEGHTNKQIAEILGLTVRAVEDRRFRLMRKVGVESAAELVGVAVRSTFFNQGFRQTEWQNDVAEQKRTCLKGIEIWEPDREGNVLSLRQGCYRDAAAFQDASVEIRFRRGEGLPGKIWEHQTPMFMGELIKTEFVRTLLADKVGMNAALGFPIFRSEQLACVIVLLLDNHHDGKAAFESWRVDPKSDNLRLIGGTYVNCDGLRRLSEFVHLPLGQGVAGIVAASARPYVSCHAADDRNVVRGAAIQAEQLATIVGIPLADSGAAVCDVFMCLSSTAHPVFRLIQIWDCSNETTRLIEEIQDGVPRLDAQVSRVPCEPDSLVMQCYKLRLPVAYSKPTIDTVSRTSSMLELSMAIALPNFVGGKLVSVTVLGT